MHSVLRNACLTSRPGCARLHAARAGGIGGAPPCGMQAFSRVTRRIPHGRKMQVTKRIDGGRQENEQTVSKTC
jgi:hypothetical protein